MLGKAMDVFISGVSLSKLRSVAMRHQVGGVGYYPTSGSPFVHMDTGSVRAWPRMTRAQLKTVFPDGRTLHLPVDGKPLSDEGRRYALAQWNQCHTVPCSGDATAIPAAEAAEVRVASLDPKQRTVSTIDIAAPTPMLRPGAGQVVASDPITPVIPFGAASDALVPMPFNKTPALMVATRGALPADGETALSALDSIGVPMPVPRLLMTPREDAVLTAYAPDLPPPDPGAQRALQLLIERSTTASAPLPVPAPARPVDTSDLRTASLGGSNGLDAMKGIFDLTWQAMTDVGGTSAIASTLTNSSIDRAPMVGLRERQIELVAPEIDHVNETLVTPVAMTDIHYADMYQPEGYLDNAAELGPLANSMVLESDLVAPPRYDQFVVRGPMLVASN
jgi:hypothetical protein